MKPDKIILVVEDFKISRELIKKMLHREGFAAVTPDGFEKAFKAAMSGRIDLVLLDLDAPADACWRLLDKLYQTGGRMPLCAGMAKDMTGPLREKCRLYGLADCFKKPVLPPEISRVIQRLSNSESPDFSAFGKLEIKSMDFQEAFKTIEGLAGTIDETSLFTIMRILDDPDMDNALLAIAADTAKKIFKDRPRYLLFGLAEGGSKTVGLCSSLAGEIGLHAAAPLLVRRAEEIQDKNCLESILRAFKNIPYEHAPAFLEKYLHSSDTVVKLAAVNGLSGQESEKAESLLARLLEDAEEIVVYGAACALGETAGPLAISRLINHIHHSSPDIRKAVSASLTKTGRAAVPEICENIPSMRDDEIILAANILGNIQDASAVPCLSDLTGHGNHNVRFQALESLGKIDGPIALETLLEGLADKEYAVLCAAVQGIDNLLEKHADRQAAIRKIVAQAEKDKETRGRIINAIVDMKAYNIFTSLCGFSEFIIDIISKVKEANHRPTLASFLGACEKIEDESTRKGSEILLKKALKGLTEPSGHILAVDDSPAVLKFYQSVLSKLNFKVITAENGAEAAGIFSENPAFDMVITDMNMPEKNGIELTKYIREEKQSAVPVVVATTESEKSQAEQALEAGADAFVTKPVSASLLEERVREFCVAG